MAPYPVFIGTGTETFTPTQSGAIATVMHQVSRCAIQDGHAPLVIARRADGAKPFQDVACKLFDYPGVPDSGMMLKVYRAERKLRGWTRLRQGPWMRNIADMLARPDLQAGPWLISNEPELAVYLRQRYANARIFCWFHNQLGAKKESRLKLDASCDGILAVSEFTADWVSRYYGISRNKILRLYNGVDLDTFKPIEHQHSDLPIIQFVGRTGIEKAPDLLLQACLELSERTKAFSVRLIGSNKWDGYIEDEYQQTLRSLVEQLAARGIDVEQTGHIGRETLPQLMATADIHVTPSRWDEPFGLTTLEGMACGLATVAGDHGGSPEILGDAGVLFKKDDASDLASKLEQLLKDADARHESAKRCRLRAEAMSWQHTWEQLSKQIENPNPKQNAAA